MRAQETCEKIIELLLTEGFRYQVTRKDVEKAIMHLRGIDERTIDRWIRALITFEYLTHEHHGIFKINPLKIPHLLSLLKDKPQTKLQ